MKSSTYPATDGKRVNKEMTNYHAAPRRTNDSAIARLRIAHGLTQAQLADLVGCHQQAVNKWETGKCKPGMQSLIKLSRTLECSIDDLVDFD